MGKVVLLSCVSRKLSRRARAKELYTSTLFKLNLAFAESLKPDAIFVLSAKHGLVDMAQEIEPYDQTLNDMSASERKTWASRVMAQLQERIDTRNQEVVFLAGEKYREHLVPHLGLVSIPLQGLGIGRQLHRLKELLGRE